MGLRLRGCVKLHPTSEVASNLWPVCRIVYETTRFADVCAAVRGREPGPSRADLAAAKGEDPGHHRLMHAPVPRVRLARTEAHTNVLEVMPVSESPKSQPLYNNGT